MPVLEIIRLVWLILKKPLFGPSMCKCSKAILGSRVSWYTEAEGSCREVSAMTTCTGPGAVINGDT